MFFKKEREEYRKRALIDVNISVLMDSLLNNRIDEVRVYLKKYLFNKNLIEFEYLFNILIDISIQKKDYDIVLEYFKLVEKDEFSYSNSEFLNMFYQSIMENNIDIAKKYLEILKHYSNLGILDALEKYVYGYEESQINKVIKEKYEELLSNEEMVKIDIPLKEKDIYINKLKIYKNVLIFPVVDHNNCTLYVLYRPYIGNVDIGNLKESAKKAYLDFDYKSSIKYNLTLIRKVKYPNDYIVSRIGISYYNLHDYSKALDYLCIAKSICNDDKTLKNYKDLINDITVIYNKEKLLVK